MFIGIKKQLRDWDEETPIQSLRFMPSEYVELGTYARPTKFHRGEKGRNSLPGMNTDYEEGILDRIKEKRSALEDYETEKDIRLPEQERERILSEFVNLPGYEQGYEMEGTWVSPADLRTILNPDVTFFQGRPTTLVGITQSPNFYRTAGEAEKGAHEGFQFGGFDPESYFRIPTPETASHPVPIKHGLLGGRDDVVNWLEDLQSNPNIPIGGRWDESSWNQWQQTPRLNLEQLTEQGLVYPRTIKGEPMENVLLFLKAFKAPVSMYHYPHELDSASMGTYLEENPNSTLGDMVVPYFQGQFTPNNSATPPSHQEVRPDQNQEINQATFPKTPEETAQIQNTMDRGFVWNNRKRDASNQQQYDDINNAVRVLSRNLRANPDFSYQPTKVTNDYQRGGGKRGRAMTRERQNARISNYLNTPVSVNPTRMIENLQTRVPIATGEPMEIAFQLLKGRKMSPEAKKHKLEYDTKYQSSPERVKYRVELNRERRRRGIYGSGNGKDVSHTKGGKLTLENEHDNRARHFKGRGTLRDDKS